MKILKYESQSLKEFRDDADNNRPFFNVRNVLFYCDLYEVVGWKSYSTQTDIPSCFLRPLSYSTFPTFQPQTSGEKKDGVGHAEKYKQFIAFSMIHTIPTVVSYNFRNR